MLRPVLVTAAVLGSAVGASPTVAAGQQNANLNIHPTLTVKVGKESPLGTNIGTCVGGALDTTGSPTATSGSLTSGPEYLTISIVNSHTNAISTTHAINYGAEPIVAGNVAAGTIGAGETQAFIAPTGWAGMVSVNDAKYPPSTDNSLIEANFAYREEDDYGMAIVDVDVSYVDGFTLPIVCSCEGEIVSGCEIHLFDYNKCPTEGIGADGACRNPLRSIYAIDADEFFAPCQGRAYTFPNDSIANSFGACQVGTVNCCVGVACAGD